MSPSNTPTLPSVSPSLAPTHGPTNNIFCNNNDWNIIKGSWNYDHIDCSLENTVADINNGANIVWFGSDNGIIPNSDYIFDRFVYQVSIKFNYNQNGAGIVIRAQNVSSSHVHGGSYYYIGFYPSSDDILFGKMNNGWQLINSISYAIDTNVIYTITIQNVRLNTSTYDVLVNNNLLMTIYDTSYLTGSIGLRTFKSPAIFYNATLTSYVFLFLFITHTHTHHQPVTFTNFKKIDETASPTNSPTIAPTNAPTDWPTYETHIHSPISINNNFISVLRIDGNLVSYNDAISYCYNKFGTSLATIYSDGENFEALNSMLNLVSELAVGFDDLIEMYPLAWIDAKIDNNEINCKLQDGILLG